MIQQARQRMSEAHQRARPSGSETAAPVPEKESPPETASDKSSTGRSGEGEGIFSALFRDKDRTVILALMLLLADENGDNSLLFALMYLLMD